VELVRPQAKWHACCQDVGARGVVAHMTTADPISAVILRMEELAPALAGDERRHFHATYLRTTRAIRDAVIADGFVDPAWVERWDARFASLYLDALEAFAAGRTVPGPWQVAFTAANEADLAPVRHVLLGMNAHINFDLPQAVVAVISPTEFADSTVVARREADHKRVDALLAERVAAEDRELKKVEAPGSRSLLDWLLTPLNRMASQRFIAEAREKVWHNAHVLDRARKAGPAQYAAALSQLERRSAERVADLRRPGQVVLRLARDGFGVRIEE
jgi:hypothetical protein